MELGKRHVKCRVSRNIPWNSMEFIRRQIKCHQVPWNSMELGGRHFKWQQGSMEFHGIFHEILWNSSAAKSNATEFNGIPWNLEGAISNDTRVTWNSMECSMEFHGICRRQIKCNKLPGNSMKFVDYTFNWQQVPLDFIQYSMAFLSYPTICLQVSWNSSEFGDC